MLAALLNKKKPRCKHGHATLTLQPLGDCASHGIPVSPTTKKNNDREVVQLRPVMIALVGMGRWFATALLKQL